MKKSKKILLYGLLGSILYIFICIYTHIPKEQEEKKNIIENKTQKPPQELKQAIQKEDNNKSIKSSSKSQSTLEYKIENGVITIAGNMPILDNEDTLKQSMMRMCGEEYCDRTIVFSDEKEMPIWKDLAKDIIDLFYEENLTDAFFWVDEFGNISIGGELLTKKSKDRIARIIKNSGIENVTDKTQLKLLRLQDAKEKEAIPQETIVKKENTLDENNSTDNNSSIEKIQTTISKLLENQKINFYRNRARLTKKSKRVLNEIIKTVKDIPDIKIIVRGYTDASGRRDINLWISQERAKSVKNYLGSHGLNPRSIEAKGFGEENLLYEDKPYSPLNRRVEIEIKRK